MPHFVPTVMVDPVTGRPLHYRRQANGFVLYSVGTDQEDDGGTGDSPDGDIMVAVRAR